ncbi:YfhO family protein [Enterococcus termitis]
MLDTDRYANVMKKVMKQGVDFTIDGRKASANVELDEEKVILTTIPYDKGWVAYVDGEKVEIPTFKEAMLTVKVPEGKHNIEFVFIPQGLLLGEIIGLGSLILFVSYLFIERRKKTKRLNLKVGTIFSFMLKDVSRSRNVMYKLALLTLVETHANR